MLQLVNVCIITQVEDVVLPAVNVNALPCHRAALASLFARARDEDLYVAYAIVPPQIDRGTPAHRHPEPFLHPGVVRETDAGIVIRGAHSIATSVTMADWLFVSYITPLVPGDEDYAISLVVPVGAAGLRLLTRRPYATLATSVYDYPLSSRFDEVDTTVVFDDVVVPWEHVFIDRKDRGRIVRVVGNVDQRSLGEVAKDIEAGIANPMPWYPPLSE